MFPVSIRWATVWLMRGIAQHRANVQQSVQSDLEFICLARFRTRSADLHSHLLWRLARSHILAQSICERDGIPPRSVGVCDTLCLAVESRCDLPEPLSDALVFIPVGIPEFSAHTCVPAELFDRAVR